MKPSNRALLLLLLMLCIFESRATNSDTAVVKSYGGVSVFYACKPLHAYTSLGHMTSNTLVSHLQEGFEFYAREARKSNTGNIGIILSDINKGADQFEVIKFAENDLHTDTAVFTTNIFLCAAPVAKYDSLGTIKNRHKVPSLNERLDFYLNLAKQQYPNSNGVILDDIEYNFELDEIKVIRWSK